MITLKSKREIELMDKAGTIVALVHKKLREVLRPGLSTYEINKICEEVIRANDATPSFKGLYGFPGAVCTSVNEILVHGIPDHKTILKDGDIITVDVGACYKGYHGDSGWTYAIGNVKQSTLDLMKVTEDALYVGLEQAKVGNRIGDISHAVQTYVEKYGYSTPIEYTGHGIGKSVHEDPYVPNVGRAHTGELIKPGMCIAVEPMVFEGSAHCVTLDNGWSVVNKERSLSAHYEHSIAILSDGYKILTKED